MTDRQAAHIPELDSCQMSPQALARIQLRGIRRQALSMESFRSARRQELLDRVTAMDRRAILEDHQATSHFAPQMLQKGHDISRVEGRFLAVKVQRTREGDGADGREMSAGPPLLQHGRLAHGGIGPDDAGQGREPRFVYAKDALRLDVCPLLMAGHVSCRQRAMAASSRWRARRAGVCGLQRRPLSRRPTWTGGEDTPHARCITAAIRLRVQTCPRKP
jgi:hypothetical protein